MRRVSVFLACCLVLPVFCFAQDSTKETASGAEKGKCPYLQMKEGHGGKGSTCPVSPDEGMGSWMGSHGRMTGSWGAALAASDKGGVIVLKGSRLYKYDKDLNLIKQAEISEGEFEAEK